MGLVRGRPRSDLDWAWGHVAPLALDVVEGDPQSVRNGRLRKMVNVRETYDTINGSYPNPSSCGRRRRFSNSVVSERGTGAKRRVAVVVIAATVVCVGVGRLGIPFKCTRWREVSGVDFFG